MNGEGLHPADSAAGYHKEEKAKGTELQSIELT